MKLIKEFPELSWSIFDNLLIDIAKINHPGGQYIIKNIKGR